MIRDPTKITEVVVTLGEAGIAGLTLRDCITILQEVEDISKAISSPWDSSLLALFIPYTPLKMQLRHLLGREDRNTLHERAQHLPSEGESG